ncbi:hypothetical protein ACFQ1R_07275 [Mariniflexile jejuense]|uniref:Outer membrane protein assembly factor BamA n=1 Tax=Mariniflexile jejuense TaxID=1173582 RepID=A0ABW3JII1_9FLAO
MQKTIALYFIIYVCVSAKLFSQNLKLSIEGNNALETTIINSYEYNKTHPNYSAIKNEIDSLQKTLLKAGYIENELNQIAKLNDSVFLAQLHLKNKYEFIHIYYDNLQVDSKLLNIVSDKVFDTYFVIAFNTIETTLNLINLKISEKGFPFSKLKLSNIEITDTNYLKANLITTSTKQKRLISDIIIKGYEKFPRSYLKYYLKIKSQQTLNLNEIKIKTERLSNLRFASEVKPPEVLFSKDSTTLYLYLQKTRSNTFDGFLGFGTNEDTNKIQFDGYLNLNLTNNLNYGESFRLLYKSDENDQKTFETNLSLPYLFKSPIGFDVSLRIFKKDSTFNTVNQAVKLHYQISPKHKVYAGVQSIQSNNLLNTNTSLTVFDYKTNYTTLAYEFLNPQSSSYIFPINSKFYIETNLGNRIQTNIKEKQSQISIDAFKIFNLNAKNSLFFRLNSAFLTSNNYLENELFRFGGINSIRGFEENSIYASLFGLINTEYRYQLNNYMYVHTIIDTAYFENKITNNQEKLIGFGFGFGVLTNSGLLKFNFANSKIENTPFKLSNYKIHLSLTANF